MVPESFQIPFVIGLIVLLIAVLVTDKIKSSLAFLFTVALLLLGGSIELGDFLMGICNPSIVTIFTLIVITAGINDHLDLGDFFDKLFGKAGNQRSFIIRMGLSVSAVSSVMNNTPVVAMMMPYVYRWGKQHNINPSRLLLPLTYSAIVGGVITLIGTSTNLVLNGLLEENQLTPLAFADFLLPGALVTIACLIFMYAFGPWLIRDKKDLLSTLEENVREYLVETRIVNGSSLVGRSVEEAGLRNLKKVFLTEIVRADTRITPVKPTEILKPDDILLFAGDTDSTLDLIQRLQGLELSKKTQFNIKDDADLVEAIVAQNSQLDRRTVKEVGFREKFDAAIIGIHRQGERLAGKIGSVQLKVGDLLLLTAGDEFRERTGRTNDLLIINTMDGKEPIRKNKMWIFALSVLISVGLIAGGVVGLLEGLMLILLAQVLLNMVNLEKVKQNVSFDLLLILASSLAIGKALIDSGSADFLTHMFFSHAGEWSPLLTLGGVFLATFILTSLITNVAAITIIFPIAYSLSATSGLSSEALFLTAAYAASCCFATPFAYQTNLMVMEAGNYNFNDFLRMGIPLSIVYALVFLTFAAFKYNLI